MSILLLHWLNINCNLNALKQATIHWQVQETNVANYQKENSTNGRIFATLAIINIIGNGENSYSFTHAQTINEVTFYRVKQIDVDGRYGYSTIIKLFNNQNGKLEIYPNPVKDIFTICVDKALLNTQAVIVNTTGVIVQQIKIEQLQTQVNIDELPSGIYMHKTAKGTTKNLTKQ